MLQRFGATMLNASNLMSMIPFRGANHRISSDSVGAAAAAVTDFGPAGKAAQPPPAAMDKDRQRWAELDKLRQRPSHSLNFQSKPSEMHPRQKIVRHST